MLYLYGQGLGQKEIAHQLGLTRGRVSQITRALKDRLGTERRSGLVAAATQLPLYTKGLEQKCSVSGLSDLGNQGVEVSLDQTALADALPMQISAPWESDAYRVGLGAFDDPGENLRRLLLMFKVALGLPALIVFLVIARWAITATVTPQP